MHLRHRRPLLLVLLGAAGVACAGRASAEGEGARGTRQVAAPRAPLATFASQPVVVTPAQRLRGGDAMGWAVAAGPTREYLAALDGEIEFAMRERNVTGWTLASDVERAARRNPTVAADPHALAVEPLLGARLPEQLGVTLASQLRMLVALGGQRYVVVPTELRFDRRDDGRGEAVLRVALVDTRRSQALWMGEVRSEPADTFSRALIVGVAERLVDLIIPPGDTRAPGA